MSNDDLASIVKINFYHIISFDKTVIDNMTDFSNDTYTALEQEFFYVHGPSNDTSNGDTFYSTVQVYP